MLTLAGHTADYQRLQPIKAVPFLAPQSGAYRDLHPIHPIPTLSIIAFEHLSL